MGLGLSSHIIEQLPPDPVCIGQFDISIYFCGLNKNCIFWRGGTLKYVSFYSQFVHKVTAVGVTVLPSPCAGFLERRAAGRRLNKRAPVPLSPPMCCRR